MRLSEISKIIKLKEWWSGFQWGRGKPKGPSALERMKALFEREKVSYRLIPHPEAYTAPEVAASIHAPGREVVKVVLVRTDEEYAMAVLPANRQIDWIRFAEVTGSHRVSLAKEREMKRLFPDCEVWAMPPFGNLYGLPVYVEESLARQPEIFFPAGSHHEVIEMRFEDFKRLARPRVDHFALQPLKKAGGF